MTFNSDVNNGSTCLTEGGREGGERGREEGERKGRKGEKKCTCKKNIVKDHFQFMNMGKEHFQ